ncbi:MAG: hypothetical protein R2741_05450 [Methanolobus sp.]
MTADIAVISDSPVVLIDEVENAGIKKQEALQLLAGEGKIVAWPGPNIPVFGTDVIPQDCYQERHG